MNTRTAGSAGKNGTADGQEGSAQIVAPTPPSVRRQGDTDRAQTATRPADDQATHGSGKRNAEVAGSDDHALAPRSRQAAVEDKT